MQWAEPVTVLPKIDCFFIKNYVPNGFGKGQAPPLAHPVLHPIEHPHPPFPSFGQVQFGPQLQFSKVVQPGPQPQSTPAPLKSDTSPKFR